MYFHFLYYLYFNLFGINHKYMLLTYYEKPSCTFYLVIAPRYFLEQSKQKIKELNQIVGSVNNCDVSKKMRASARKKKN